MQTGTKQMASRKTVLTTAIEATNQTAATIENAH